MLFYFFKKCKVSVLFPCNKVSQSKSVSCKYFASFIYFLGDFAVLLAAGLSVNQALVMNYISALTAFLGGIVGVAVGTTSDATPWIFAITGGLFVYLALTNMVRFDVVLTTV